MTISRLQYGTAWTLFAIGIILGFMRAYDAAAYTVASACWWYLVAGQGAK